ncbi:hypothetical protein FHR97_000377 [Halomonas stenophila]|uniref:Uncharacterized protein n=1 Tax=Halomonas stenophila TaxID=795312 RepID=A0A7W5EQG4_9GAMM|nr:hypothetical protein [Halomonas stenophila]
MSEDSRFTIDTRHHIRQHVFILVKSIWVWLFLQIKFFLLDARLIMFKRVCVYHAALKTSSLGEKRVKRNQHLKMGHLVDEGALHVLLMHKFASLKEKAAWSYFSRKQLCQLVEDKNVIVFFLSVDEGLRRERLERRNEIESERLRVENNLRSLAFGPLGIEFIRSVTCDGDGRLKVVVVDNNAEGGIESNVEGIREAFLAHRAYPEHLSQ